MIPLRRPSIQLNKFLTVVKTSSFENAIRIIYLLEIWLTYKVIFLRPARSTISSPWAPNRTLTLLRGLSIQLNKPLTVLETTFFEKAQEYVLSSKSDNLSSTFFSDQPDQQ